MLLSEDELRAGVARMADEITAHYRDRSLTIVGVLTGSIVLLADLIRRLDMPLRLALVQARSYRGRATTPSNLSLNADMLLDVRDRDVLVVDDIFDTGRTLFELVARLDELQVASLRSAVLLRKQGRQQVARGPDFVGFDIPDEFVVGYGLDYDDMYRNLPYLAVLEAADIEQAGPA
ncbi:MAG: hypoxanthine phosphoribosyltransferase [Planctomycetaceae bacterium]|nr:hypoxanthine phosphoribosyltransferase [Planctomycetaceae bacterium]